MIEIGAVEAAARLIEGRLVRTPTVSSPGLSDLLGAQVTAKLELLQRTGSFKARGALAKLLSLSPAELAVGVLAVSGGNHGVAVAETARLLDVKATVCMARTAPARSIAAVQAAGASIQLADTMDEAFALMERLRAEGQTLVHPFDDPVVIAGQGTVGLELDQDAAPGAFTDVLVSIGGGGLISGIAVALQARRPDVRVWGVETAGAESMSRALAAGGPVPVPLTSIVTTLSAPSVARITYEHVAALVEDVIVVSDAEAVQGVRDMAHHAKLWTEPATACVLPAARRVLERVGPDARLALIACGGNADLNEVLRA
ncbi:pyridoxal-phosphate dependent enzyme [Streptomyces sp. NPDC020412]|uniref:pyridoxal-phosphate dependent enzyme n=1 Tax=Streptomyces sp. NPDC020412 TaxID=3365073 RepID=UPI003793DD21